MALPSLSDLGALIGTFTSSGKLGQAGAGAAAANLAGTVQTDILLAANKAGAFLGPILGTAGTAAFSSGAANAATVSQDNVTQKYFGFSVGQLGGYAALGAGAAVLIYLALRRR